MNSLLCIISLIWFIPLESKMRVLIHLSGVSKPPEEHTVFRATKGKGRICERKYFATLTDLRDCICQVGRKSNLQSLSHNLIPRSMSFVLMYPHPCSPTLRLCQARPGQARPGSLLGSEINQPQRSPRSLSQPGSFECKVRVEEKAGGYEFLTFLGSAHIYSLECSYFSKCNI